MGTNDSLLWERALVFSIPLSSVVKKVLQGFVNASREDTTVWLVQDV